MAKESFLRGAVILAAASLFNRLIGIIYMVILPRIIHDEGMGLYQLVKPLHYFAAVLAICGLPLAIAKLVAENAAQGSLEGIRRVFRRGLALMILTGSSVALVLIFGARHLAAAFVHDTAVEPLIAILGPACFFLALSAAFRGFFQGLQQMAPSAISQVADQIVRIGATLFFVFKLRPLGIEKAVAGIGWGFVCGEFTGWLVLAAYYVTKKNVLLAEVGPPKTRRPPAGGLTKRLISLALPAVTATVLWPVMQLADSLLIPVRMRAAGFAADAIREGLGHFGMALLLSQLPNIITVALATSLVPAISEAWALGKRKLLAHRAEEALRVALVFGMPAFAFLYILAEPISQILFSYPQVGAPLRILALGTVTLGLIQSTTGILHGLGAMLIPVRNLFCGVLVKFALNYLLVAEPSLGILGAALSTTVCWALVAVLNLYAVFRRVGVVIHLRNSVIKPFLGTLAAGLTAHYLQGALSKIISEAPAALLSLAAGLSLYFLLLVRWGTIKETDLALLPIVGKPLARALHAWGLFAR
ncbi:MAG TPA: polysaccharide biosynthesis protein [Firmicutes bacterium]|nr:polysaccharide biosynthesis protein [Bacillota bacterium]